MPEPTLDIYHADNLDVLPALPTSDFDLIYIDPPFNTGKAQRRTQLTTTRDEQGDRTGFTGARYRSTRHTTRAFDDAFADFPAFLEPRLIQARRLLTDAGSLFVHLDPHEAHYIKVLLDQLFGRDSFMNEIIWAYDYGGRSKTKWAAKHDTILWYAKDPKNYTYNQDEIDRIPYMAPGLVTKEKADRGKRPTDVWWHTIVSPTGKEKTGYPTQKPRGIIDRIIKVHSNPGDNVLDFFAGSGTTGESALHHGRNATLIDQSADAIEVQTSRLASFGPRRKSIKPQPSNS